MLAQTLIGNTVTLLAEGLAILLGVGSAAFYLSAFIFPEVHRRLDALWSGLGLFYAGVLWFSAGQMTGAVLLGQMTAVALLLGLGWQTLKVRREKTPVYQQTPITLTPEVVGGWAKSKINQLRIVPDDSVRVATLEKRSDRIDPRRRPVYDYEFVEDGVAGDVPDVPTEGGLDLNSFADVSFDVTSFVSKEQVSDKAAESDTYIVPPNADAEIIAELSPTAEKASADIEPADTESVDTAPAVDDFESTAISVSEASAVASSESSAAPKSETPLQPVPSDSSEHSEPEDGENSARAITGSPNDLIVNDEVETADDVAMSSDDAEVPKPQMEVSTGQIDEWDDDWFDSESESGTAAVEEVRSPNQLNSAQSQSSEFQSQGPSAKAQTKEKPGLLAIPVILVGWLKDVVTSIAKPKPSKPVIEIPRRETQRGQTASSTRRSPASAQSATDPSATQQPISEASVPERSVSEQATANPVNQTPEPKHEPRAETNVSKESDPVASAYKAARSEFVSAKDEANKPTSDSAINTIDESNWSDDSNWPADPAPIPSQRYRETPEESNWDD